MMSVVKRVFLLTAALLWCGGMLTARTVPVKGRVTCGGQGVAGVVVTDGAHFAATDAKGRYTLEADDENRFVYLSIPAGFRAPVEKGVVKHYRPMPAGGGVCDFTLTASPADETRHGFVVIADPQIWARKEFRMLEHAADDIAATVGEYPGRPFFGICCGDIVSHDHTLYPEYNAVMERSGLTFRNAMGNHDMKVFGRSFETSFSEFEAVYGPTYYSFNVGAVHYVVLNDNFFIGRDYFYIGYLEERQLRWLERDLSYIPHGSTVVVCLHIPSTCADEDRKQFQYRTAGLTMTNHRALHAILKPYNAHILSGHTHTTCNQRITDSLYEHVIPALSGAWWQGELCTDGTPRGYGVFTVDGGKVSWHYRSTGHSAEHQMTLYDGNDHPQFAGYVAANIWASDPTWHVELRVDGHSVGTMERFEAYDPAAQRMYATTEHMDHKWIYPSISDHFYRMPRPDGNSRIEVAATDPFGRQYIQILTPKPETR